MLIKMLIKSQVAYIVTFDLFLRDLSTTSIILTLVILNQANILYIPDLVPYLYLSC